MRNHQVLNSLTQRPKVIGFVEKLVGPAGGKARTSGHTGIVRKDKNPDIRMGLFYKLQHFC